MTVFVLLRTGHATPHMTYIDHNSSTDTNAVKYASRTGDGWQTQVVWEAPESLYSSCSGCWSLDYLSVAAAPGGDAYIAFYDPWSRDLKLAFRPAGPHMRVYLSLIAGYQGRWDPYFVSETGGEPNRVPAGEKDDKPTDWWTP